MANHKIERVADAAHAEHGQSACASFPAEPYGSIVDSKGLSQILGLHEMSIRRMVSQGRLPHYKIGSSVRFSLAEVLEFVHRSAEGGVQ